MFDIQQQTRKQMRTRSNQQSRVSGGMCLLVAGLVFSALCFLKAMPGSPLRAETVGSSPDDTSLSTSAPLGYRTKNIEDIRVGDRVLTDNPDIETSAETSVDPETWRKLVLRAEQRWPDGTIDDINVETLQPPDWISAVDARIGASVPLPLDLVEMGLPEELRAGVVAIDRCPPIRPGPGRVVLTTVNHLNNYVFELTVRSAEGHETTIRPTGFHKFHRPNDDNWVSAEDLHPGDALQGVAGTFTVVSIRQFAGTHRVYNMTVEGEHVYYAGTSPLLVHNNCGKPPKPRGRVGPRRPPRELREGDVEDFIDDIEGIETTGGRPDRMSGRLDERLDQLERDLSK